MSYFSDTGHLTESFLSRNHLLARSRVSLPPLVAQFVKFCKCSDKFKEGGKIDLSWETFFPPTFALPLAVLLESNRSAPRILPMNEDARSYLATILQTKVEARHTNSYLPVVRLPSDENESDKVLSYVYEVQKNEMSAFGGEMAFKYVVSELVDNIYQHSKFKIAFLSAQRYPKLGYVELSFIDDGITIQGSYRAHKMRFQPQEAIVKALSGLSTKSAERGWGLRTSIRIFREGLKGQILIVSGQGAVYLDGKKEALYKLSREHKMNGTLVSLRVPYPSPIVDIYQYIG